MVIANGYLTGGYPGLALDSFRALLNRNTLGVVLLFVQIEITYLVIAAALAYFRDKPLGARRSNAVLWILVATGFALWSLQATLWFPRAGSARGALLFPRRGARGGRRVPVRGLPPGDAAARGGAGAAGARRRPQAGAALLLLAGVNVAAAALEVRAPEPRPNILLITIDTLRADHLGAYGYARPTSPNIDRLARGGVLFAVRSRSGRRPARASPP